MKFISTLLLLMILPLGLLAEEAPLVGKKAADKYFQIPEEEVSAKGGAREVDESEAKSWRPAPGEEMMMLGLGSFLNSQTYNWAGAEKRESVGRINYGFTYLLHEEERYDLNLRVEFSEYRLGDDRAFKMSTLPVITFPRFSAKFPVYFGVGAGLGIFFNQVPDESSLSFDYQLIAGVRLMELVPNAGFYIEMAIKNHLLLTTNGQFNGLSLGAGGVFRF